MGERDRNICTYKNARFQFHINSGKVAFVTMRWHRILFLLSYIFFIYLFTPSFIREEFKLCFLFFISYLIYFFFIYLRKRSIISFFSDLFTPVISARKKIIYNWYCNICPNNTITITTSIMVFTCRSPSIENSGSKIILCSILMLNVFIKFSHMFSNGFLIHKP